MKKLIVKFGFNLIVYLLDKYFDFLYQMNQAFIIARENGQSLFCHDEDPEERLYIGA